MAGAGRWNPSGATCFVKFKEGKKMVPNRVGLLSGVAYSGHVAMLDELLRSAEWSRDAIFDV
jgi:hypothetical protein